MNYLINVSAFVLYLNTYTEITSGSWHKLSQIWIFRMEDVGRYARLAFRTNITDCVSSIREGLIHSGRVNSGSGNVLDGRVSESKFSYGRRPNAILPRRFLIGYKFTTFSR